MKKLLLSCAGVLLLMPVLRPAAMEQAAEDEKVLREAGVEPTPASLLAFFRKRTLTEQDLIQVRQLVARLGSDSFTEREEASRELVLRGTAIRPLLREALDNPDPEVRRRSRLCLEEIEGGPGPALPIAAGRTLARHPSATALAAILDYLPFNEEDLVEEELLRCLLVMTEGAREADHALIKGIDARPPAVRGAAAHVLARRGLEKERVLRLLSDPAPLVRLRAAEGLVAGGDTRGVPALIDLAGGGPEHTAWRAEDALYRLAGERGPAVIASSGTVGERQKGRDAWHAWWKANEKTLDLGRYHEGDRLLGLTLGIEYNTGRVWESTMEGTLRWQINGLQGPMEAQMLSGGRVLIAESNGHRVTERDLNGKVLWEAKVPGEPTGCQRLHTGNTFVSTYNSVMEIRRDGSIAYEHKLPSGSNAIRMGSKGHILFVAGREITEMDTRGKTLRTVRVPGDKTSWVGIHDLPGDRFLVASSSTGEIVEVDRTGKQLWEAKLPGACGIARLPNGHTLVGVNLRVVELDRGGHMIWQKETTGYVRRVHRR